MKKSELARQMRDRQYKLGILPDGVVDSFSDDQVIDCYITCPDCGEKLVNAVELEHAIRTTECYDEFMDLCKACGGECL